MEKLFVYIDETGKHNKSEQFIVCVIVVEKVRLEEVQQTLLKIEQSSGKNRRKWANSHHARQSAYISQLIETPSLHHIAYGRIFPSLEAEVEQKCTAIAEALQDGGLRERKIHVLVDGEISRTEEMQYKKHLKERGVRPTKVKGIRKGTDDPISRLADALCGLVRANVARDEMTNLYRKTVQSGTMTPL